MRNKQPIAFVIVITISFLLFHVKHFLPFCIRRSFYRPEMLLLFSMFHVKHSVRDVRSRIILVTDRILLYNIISKFKEQKT